jgi:hypothetical protein
MARGYRSGEMAEPAERQTKTNGKTTNGKETRDPETRTLTFTGEGLEALLEIAKRENKTLDEVVEDALGLKQWALDVKKSGDEVVVRHGRKDKYRLVI